MLGVFKASFVVEEGLHPLGGLQRSPLRFIDTFSSIISIIYPLQRSFNPDLRYFREELQGWLQWLFWEVISLVEEPLFHPEDVL